tara:strand:- start:102 stop:1166 length:1065 start_codon:yes stop_codon:yes gene_type:complete
VRAVALTTLLLLSTAISGCLSVPAEECEGIDCFPLNPDALSDILAAPGAFDVISLAATNDKLRIVTTTTYEDNGQFAEVRWDVAKDDVSQLRSIAMRMTIGTTTIDNEVIEGQSTTNIRTEGFWYEGRDEVPEYGDPFIELAQLATQQPNGLWPPFAFDTSAVADLSWTISGDPTSTQQIASASNNTHTIIIELMGYPPKITGIETYSGDEDTFILTVATGDSVLIELKDDLPRTAVGFSIDNQPIIVDETTVWYGEIPDVMSTEINPSQLEFHGIAIVDGTASSVAMMTVDQVSSNMTLDDGTWWEFNWLDFPMPGYFSSGDLYQIKTNSTGELHVAIFDNWAQQWTGGPLLE